MPRTTTPEALRRSFAFVDSPTVREEYRKENDNGRSKAIAAIQIEAPEGFRRINIEVYACPTPDCPDFFGHHGMPELGDRVIGDKDINFGPKPDEEHRTRATCPTCFTRGLRVERVRVDTFAFVPLEAPTA